MSKRSLVPIFWVLEIWDGAGLGANRIRIKYPGKNFRARRLGSAEDEINPLRKCGAVQVSEQTGKESSIPDKISVASDWVLWKTKLIHYNVFHGPVQCFTARSEYWIGPWNTGPDTISLYLIVIRFFLLYPYQVISWNVQPHTTSPIATKKTSLLDKIIICFVDTLKIERLLLPSIHLKLIAFSELLNFIIALFKFLLKLTPDHFAFLHPL